MGRRQQWTQSTLAGLLACTPVGEKSPTSEPNFADSVGPKGASQREANQDGNAQAKAPSNPPASPAAAALPAPPPTTIPTLAAPPAPADEAAAHRDLPWKKLHFALAGIHLEVFDSTYSTRAWPKGGVLQQTLALEDSQGQSLQILLRAGEDETLAAFLADRENESTTTSPIAHTTTCGRPSQHIEVSAPRIDIQCVIRGDGRPNSPRTVPPMTTIAESFHYGELDVIVSWRLPTSLRERYRDDERRFFASLRCDDDATRTPTTRN